MASGEAKMVQIQLEMVQNGPKSQKKIFDTPPNIVTRGGPRGRYMLAHFDRGGKFRFGF